tara:strand:- start:635 stop:856 length:222 start_codon:yes stop_codon:yes gene_type:complete
MVTQKQRVLDHLQGHPSGFTSWEAISEYGITRLAAYIGFLRDDGYKIDAVSETRDGKTFSRYFLVTEEEGTAE